MCYLPGMLKTMIVISFVYSAHTEDFWLCGDAAALYYLNAGYKSCMVTVSCALKFDVHLIKKHFISDKERPG